MSQIVLSAVPSSAVATSGTIVFTYPTGMTAGNFAPYGHKMFARGLQTMLKQDEAKISVALGAASATVTYKGTTSIPANTQVDLELNIAGDGALAPRVLPADVSDIAVVKLTIGAPAAAAANAISLSQSVTSGVAALLNGATAGTLDFPRNVVAAWTNTAIATVTGRDEYGNVMIEQSASGVAMTGKKAFKSITSVVFNASVTGCTVGTGDVLGLPIFLPGLGSIIKELQDGATATAGTPLAGVQTTPTATTGDVRGTYDPNAACDGAKVFELIVAVGDPAYTGVNQYAG